MNPPKGPSNLRTAAYHIFHCRFFDLNSTFFFPLYMWVSIILYVSCIYYPDMCEFLSSYTYMYELRLCFFVWTSFHHLVCVSCVITHEVLVSLGFKDVKSRTKIIGNTKTPLLQWRDLSICPLPLVSLHLDGAPYACMTTIEYYWMEISKQDLPMCNFSTLLNHPNP